MLISSEFVIAGKKITVEKNHIEKTESIKRNSIKKVVIQNTNDKLLNQYDKMIGNCDIMFNSLRKEKKQSKNLKFLQSIGKK